MKLTWLDSNSWLIEASGMRILLDPWLIGPLVFANLPWLFKSSRTVERPIPENIHLILLSQGLEDHTHPPTLSKLDHQIPVVASPNAGKIVKELGYTEVATLNHGENTTIGNLTITAVPGSPIGPQLRENGYILKDTTTGESLYYEPHGFHSPVIKDHGPVDIVITPIIDIKIPLLGPVIQGRKAALQACEWLHPKVIIPTAAGGDVVFEGLLTLVLRAEGSPEQLQEDLVKQQINTKVVKLSSWEEYCY